MRSSTVYCRFPVEGACEIKMVNASSRTQRMHRVPKPVIVII
jgi:hypothetical protein